MKLVAVMYCAEILWAMQETKLATQLLLNSQLMQCNHTTDRCVISITWIIFSYETQWRSAVIQICTKIWWYSKLHTRGKQYEYNCMYFKENECCFMAGWSDTAQHWYQHNHTGSHTTASAHSAKIMQLFMHIKSGHQSRNLTISQYTQYE